MRGRHRIDRVSNRRDRDGNRIGIGLAGVGAGNGQGICAVVVCRWAVGEPFQSGIDLHGRAAERYRRRTIVGDGGTAPGRRGKCAVGDGDNAGHRAAHACRNRDGVTPAAAKHLGSIFVGGLRGRHRVCWFGNRCHGHRRLLRRA